MNISPNDPSLPAGASAVRSKVREAIVAMAGVHADELLADPVAASHLLESPDRNLRRAAAQALAIVWRVAPESESAAALVHAARLERDPDARGELLSAVGFVFRGTDDVAVGAQLAAVVADAGEHPRTRRSAYFSLLMLRWDLAKFSGDFPECIDWSIVGRFMDLHRSAEPMDEFAGLARSFFLPAEPAHLNAARALRLLSRGSYAQAESLATSVLTVANGVSVTVMMLICRARARLACGDPEGAVEDITRAIGLDPQNADALRVGSDAYAAVRCPSRKVDPGE